MARGEVQIAFEKKKQVWQVLANHGTNAEATRVTRLGEHSVRKIKKELPLLSYDEWRLLDDMPLVQSMHPQYATFYKERREELFARQTSILEKWVAIDDLRHVLCSCLYNPHAEGSTLRDWKPLHIDGVDYRLDPTTWFYLSTPDFAEESYWGARFRLLKEYMEGTGFWEHYRQLQTDVSGLQADYEKAASTLAKEDKVFNWIWTKIRVKRSRMKRPLRIPTNPAPNLDEHKPCYESEYCDQVMTKFKKLIPDFFDRLCDLERELQWLNDDLLCP